MMSALHLEFDFWGDAEGDFRVGNSFTKRGDTDRIASSDLFLRMKGGTKLGQLAHSLGGRKGFVLFRIGYKMKSH
jgi:hypothetical protein